MESLECAMAGWESASYSGQHWAAIDPVLVYYGLLTGMHNTNQMLACLLFFLEIDCDQ